MPFLYLNYNLYKFYYQFEDNHYQIPTNGYILKIIDFGRGIVNVNNKVYFSDVFEYHNDAGEQYTYPFEKKRKGVKNVNPNMSFDLSRLSS
mgnify:CR=1 FL=1